MTIMTSIDFHYYRKVHPEEAAELERWISTFADPADVMAVEWGYNDMIFVETVVRDADGEILVSRQLCEGSIRSEQVTDVAGYARADHPSPPVWPARYAQEVGYVVECERRGFPPIGGGGTS